MSRASTRKRNKITLALGAFSMITFGGVYGLIAHNAAIDQSAAVAAVAATSDVQATALALTGDPAVAPTAVPTPAATVLAATDTVVVATLAPTAVPTAVPTAQPVVAQVDTHTRAS